MTLWNENVRCTHVDREIGVCYFMLVGGIPFHFRLHIIFTIYLYSANNSVFKNGFRDMPSINKNLKEVHFKNIACIQVDNKISVCTETEK